MPIIHAHRGASAYAPENTLPAFRLALEQKADGIETDIHLTRDGRFVVCHDDEIARTSNGQGKIQDMTVEQLKEACTGCKHGFCTGCFDGKYPYSLEDYQADKLKFE